MAKITCPDCHNKVDDNATFCDNCGYTLKPSNPPAAASSGIPMVGARWESPPQSAVAYPPGNVASGTCSACGHINTPGEMFCENCGVQLAPVASVPPPPPVPVGPVVQAPPPPAATPQPPVAQPQASTVSCPSCGFTNPSAELFCQNCGYQLSEKQAPHPAPSAPQPAQPTPPKLGAALAAELAAKLPESRPAAAPAARPCPVCGYINLPGDVFCSNCGYEFKPIEKPTLPPVPTPAVIPQEAMPPPAPVIASTTCPVCGTPNSAQEEFCVNCGFLLASQAVGTQMPLEQRGVAPAEPAPPTPAFEPPPVAPAAESLPAIPSPESAASTDSGPITSQWPPLESVPVITGRLFSPATNSDLPLPPKAEILIGRGDLDRGVFPDIDLGSQGKVAGSVSRRHARLLLQGEQVLVEDLNSTNSTYVNKIRIEPGKPVLLKPGDELRLGGITLVYYAD